MSSSPSRSSSSYLKSGFLSANPDSLWEEYHRFQADIVDHIGQTHPAIDLRFSREKLPLRGTIADPSLDYDTGMAVFQVEETDVPLHLGQAAVTESGSLVAAMERYFALVWEYESEPVR